MKNRVFWFLRMREMARPEPHPQQLIITPHHHHPPPHPATTTTPSDYHTTRCNGGNGKGATRNRTGTSSTFGHYGKVELLPRFCLFARCILPVVFGLEVCSHRVADSIHLITPAYLMPARHSSSRRRKINLQKEKMVVLV